MREIKLRAWCQRLKKYYFNVGTHPSIMQWCEDYKKESPGALIVSPLYENYIIEQFTGLRDKNGREIYEGDIVSDGMWQSYGCLNGTHEVKFEDGGFYPFCVPKWECTMDIKGCEIIGTIHENPELLS